MPKITLPQHSIRSNFFSPTKLLRPASGSGHQGRSHHRFKRIVKPTLCFCLILIVASLQPSFGQGRDTVFAVHKLFREKRASGEGLQAAGNKATTDAKYVGHAAPTAQEARQNALGNTVFTTVGVLQSSRYSVENEAEVLKRYSEGWGLPPDIRRKLRRKHFHRTAHDLLAN